MLALLITAGLLASTALGGATTAELGDPVTELPPDIVHVAAGGDGLLGPNADLDGADRPRALIIGDSNIYGELGKALHSSLEALGYDVRRKGKPTSGLARPDFWDWNSHASSLIAEQHPDVIIAMWGGNDGQRCQSPEMSGSPIWFRDTGLWEVEYEDRVRQFVHVLRGAGRRVFILSPTNRRPRIAREKMRRIQAIQQAAVADAEGVTWIDMFPLSSDDNGDWLRDGLDVLGRPVRYRRGDGIHLTPEGGDVVARRLLSVLLDEGLLSCSR